MSGTNETQLKEKPGWFGDITAVFWNLRRASNVLDRFKLQKTQPTMPVEVHVVRLGDMAIATNRFELYVDYGARIKARSKAVQTFVVQLAGQASYLPTKRSIAGGSYGAIPESTLVGPEGGQMLRWRNKTGFFAIRHTIFKSFRSCRTGGRTGASPRSSTGTSVALWSGCGGRWSILRLPFGG